MGCHRLPEGRLYSCRASSGCSVVLVDEAAEPVAAADLTRGRSRSLYVRVGRTEFDRAVGPLTVVMVDVDAQHAFELAAVEDQQPVETLRAHGPDEALRGRVRPRRPHRCLDDPDTLAAEDLVEGAAVPAVSVADQHADALLGEVEAEVARLLGDPGAGRIGCAAGEPDASAAMSDEEQRVMTAQEHTLDGEQVAGDDARRLRS